MNNNDNRPVVTIKPRDYLTFHPEATEKRLKEIISSSPGARHKLVIDQSNLDKGVKDSGKADSTDINDYFIGTYKAVQLCDDVIIVLSDGTEFYYKRMYPTQEESDADSN